MLFDSPEFANDSLIYVNKEEAEASVLLNLQFMQVQRTVATPLARIYLTS